MKRLLKLPRKRRDLIGGVTVLIGFIVSFLLLGSNIVPVGVLPFVIFSHGFVRKHGMESEKDRL